MHSRWCYKPRNWKCCCGAPVPIQHSISPHIVYHLLNVITVYSCGVNQVASPVVLILLSPPPSPPNLPDLLISTCPPDAIWLSPTHPGHLTPTSTSSPPSMFGAAPGESTGNQWGQKHVAGARSSLIWPHKTGKRSVAYSQQRQDHILPLLLCRSRFMDLWSYYR